MTFIGKVISSGKLKVVNSPEGCPEFIGHLTIPSKTGDLELMYFKEYYFENKKLKFSTLEVVDTEIYSFNMCFMRIPSNFQHIAIDKNNENEIHETNHDQKVFGLTLLNIHISNPDDKCPAEKTMLEVQTHYGKPFKNLDPLVKPPSFYGGLKGCKSLGFAGSLSDQVPLFYGKPPINQYYMLSLGTEATIGYCIFKDRDDLIEEVLHIEEELKPKSDRGKDFRLGVKLVNPEIYTVDGFDNKFGVHTIERKIPGVGNENKKGWGIGWFEVDKY